MAPICRLGFVAVTTIVLVLSLETEGVISYKTHDNSWCFKSVYDYDNCPEKSTLHECVRCCSDLRTYYEQPPSKNVCLAACADKFPKLRIEWTWD